jgi:hypothetical protein
MTEPTITFLNCNGLIESHAAPLIESLGASHSEANEELNAGFPAIVQRVFSGDVLS